MGADEDDNISPFVRTLDPFVTARIHVWLLKHVQDDIEPARGVQIGSKMPATTAVTN